MKPALHELPLPKYIAIEGPIGVGKTSLANLIADKLNARKVFEKFEENPFLKDYTSYYFLSSKEIRESLL